VIPGEQKDQCAIAEKSRFSGMNQGPVGRPAEQIGNDASDKGSSDPQRPDRQILPMCSEPGMKSRAIAAPLIPTTSIQR